MTVIPIGRGKSGVHRAIGRVWVFESILGRSIEERIPEGSDVEGLCCKMTIASRLPTRCYPKIIESSSGHKRGAIII